MITVNSNKEAEKIMASIGLIQDDYYGEPGRTYWKLPEEGIVCQSTIDTIGDKTYICFYGKHTALYEAIYGEEK